MINIIFFYKGFYGEIFAGLPFILKMLNERDDLNPVFVYSDDNLYKNIPPYYIDIIKNNFTVFKITKKNFVAFFAKYIFKKNLIITCTSGHTPYSKLLTFYGWLTRVAFFHHSYALSGSDADEKTLKNRIAYYKYRTSGYHHYPLIISHNKLDIKSFEKFGFLKKNIILAGHIGYKKEWLNLVSNFSNNLEFLHKLKQNYEKTIFVPTRDVHDSFLTQKNSDYLLHSLLEFIKIFPNYLFVIKIHPRQKNKKTFEELLGKFKNIIFTDISTVMAGSLSDLTISFWSGAIIDVLASGGTVVEFHRHEVFHIGLTETQNGLVSLYHKYDLCPFYKDKREIIELLYNPGRWEFIKNKQNRVFNKIFKKEHPDFVDNLFDRFKNTPIRYKYIFEFFFYPVMFMGKIIEKQFKKILKIIVFKKG